jgi:protein subunit release factor B
MTDLHTHILPGMDDGSPDVETSIAMLRMEAEQGVHTVVLTPHFYRDRERPEHFLSAAISPRFNWQKASRLCRRENGTSCPASLWERR